jgi:hypothetical protein
MTTDQAGGACDVVVAKLRINAALEVRVQAQPYNGKCYVHIREYALTRSDEFVPTPKGVSVPASQVDDVLEAIQELRDAGSLERTVAAIALDKTREVRFSVTKWQGTTRADIRLYVKPKAAQELVPTAKGVRLNLGMLQELERAIELLSQTLHGR